jgi:hypothetical protein
MRKRCEPHNLAVGLDGYCVLCRSHERARRTPRLALIVAVVALVPIVVVAAMFLYRTHQAEAMPFKSGVSAVRPGFASVEELPTLTGPLPEAIANGPIFTLADVGGHPNIAPNAVAVWVTRDKILVNDKEILQLPPKSERAKFGTGAATKRSGPNDLFIVPLGNEVTRVGQSKTDSILYIDATTEFRLLVEILFTLGQSGSTRYLLATELPKRDPSLPFRSWANHPPGFEGPGANRRWLTVFQVHDGMLIKFEGKSVGPDCIGNGPGLTLPKQEGLYDFAGLTACAEKLGKTGGVIGIGYITGSPAVTFEDLLRTIQSLDAAGVHQFGFKVTI